MVSNRAVNGYPLKQRGAKKLTEEEHEDHTRDERLPRPVLCLDVFIIFLSLLCILHRNRLCYHQLLTTGCIPWMTAV